MTQPATLNSLLKNLPLRTAYCVSRNVIGTNNPGQGECVSLAYRVGSPVITSVCSSGLPTSLPRFQWKSNHSVIGETKHQRTKTRIVPNNSISQFSHQLIFAVSLDELPDVRPNKKGHRHITLSQGPAEPVRNASNDAPCKRKEHRAFERFLTY